MQSTTIKKYLYLTFLLLALFYIGLLLGMITIHYHELASIVNTNIYDTAEQYNWKYWFEASDSQHTQFSIFLQYIDMHYFQTQGIFPIVINIGFIFFFVALIASIIHDLFNSKDNNTVPTQIVLVFFTVILLFSSIQDSSIVWIFNQQLFAAYFSPLLSYYLLIKFSQSTNNKYFYFVLLSGLMIVLATPYSVSALIILFLLGHILKLSWFKNLLITALLILAFILHYNDLFSSMQILNQFSGDQILLYVLNYLGSLFIYMSFEPCIATSSVLGGIIIVCTFLYFGYLAIRKKITEPAYMIILAFLFFYILTAFATLGKIKGEHIVVFQNQYMTPSLISWALILVLYVHYFNTVQVAKRRILILSTTLIVVLFFYQIFSYYQYEKKISELKIGARSLKLSMQLGIDDEFSLKNFSTNIYTMMYCPSRNYNKNMSMFTYNDIRIQSLREKKYLLKLLDKNEKIFIATEKLPIKANKQYYVGGIDKFLPINKKKNIVQIQGWVYDIKDKKIPGWLMVFDERNTFIGYIVTGTSRMDVKNVYGENALKSGFYGYIRYSTIPEKLFLVNKSEKKVLEVKYLKK